MAELISRLELVKKYLRIDDSEDDDVLAVLIESAKLDLEDSGVPESDDSRYEILVALHVTLYNENRDPGMKIEKLSYVYQNLLLKLKKFSQDS